MSKEAIKRFLIETSVENAEGSQTWYVDATSEAEALKQYEQGGCDLYASNVDVTSLGEPEISGETTLDDFGDFAEQPAQQEPGGPSGHKLSDFQEGQWWLRELDAAVAGGTCDQKRAVAVVRNMLATAQAHLAEQPAQQEQESWEDLHNALQRIDTAAVGLPTFEVLHEGGLDAVTQNIVDAITALHTQPAQQEPVVNPFEDKSVISALSWAAGLIEQAYRECGGHNGADSWLMNYADKQGERIRQADRREWEKVNGRWQVKANPLQRKPLTDDEMDTALRKAGVVATFEALRSIGREVEAAHGIKENT